MPAVTAKPAPSHSLRDTLFGDLPLDVWAGTNTPTSPAPWNLFAKSRDNLAAGRTGDAIDNWRKVLSTPGLESRHYLQAWHFLRGHNTSPTPNHAKDILGVIVEVGMPEGLDLLAAYPDHSARYYNYSGAGVIWEHPDSSLNKPINALLSAAAAVVSRIGPWDKPRPAPPPPDQVRLNFLTPSGLHFGQAAITTMQQDPLGGPTFAAATQLMIAMTKKSTNRQ
jgi:hypothetical protein